MSEKEPPIPVLLVEDDPEDAMILKEQLAEVAEPRFTVEQAGSVAGAFERAGKRRFEAVLLDLMLPDSRGLETFDRMRRRFPDIPIVMLTGLADESLAVEAVKAGAQDYLVKGQVTGSLLARSIRYAIERQRNSHYRALMAERERFDAAIRQMSDAIIVTDHQWRIATFNRAAKLLLNLSEEGKGRMLEEVLEDFILSEPLADLKTARQPVSAFTIARPFTRPPLFLDARLNRQMDSAGNLLGTVLLARDVTEERCDQRARADFLSMVSHKLRTPLTVLASFLHLLRKLPGEMALKQLPDVVDACEMELDRMAQMVSTLIDLKFFGELEVETEPQRADVRTAFDAAADKARKAHPEKSVEVTVEVAPEAASVAAGADHLRFVLEKLLDNAVKFADKKPARIVLQAEREDLDLVRLSVSDNGPGIPHEYYDQVFEGFVQLEARPTGQVPGLGLGLHMARRVVEAYGGEMSIRSRLREGTTVSFTLPLTEPVAQESPA